MIRTFILRCLVNFVALWTAASLLSGVNYEDDRMSVLIIAAIIFSVVNALVRPFIILMALPVVLLTLGLFTFVVNAGMLYLVSVLYPKFEITSFPQALLAALIVWAVNYLLTDLLEKRES